MLDQERCILCTRCVRFLDEVTKTGELGVFERGNHCAIDLFPGKRLDNAYSGNVVDICPVGALTNKDFRFRARVWYLERTPVGVRELRHRLQHRHPPSARRDVSASARATIPTSTSTGCATRAG